MGTPFNGYILYMPPPSVEAIASSIIAYSACRVLCATPVGEVQEVSTVRRGTSQQGGLHCGLQSRGQSTRQGFHQHSTLRGTSDTSVSECDICVQFTLIISCESYHHSPWDAWTKNISTHSHQQIKHGFRVEHIEFQDLCIAHSSEREQLPLRDI